VKRSLTIAAVFLSVSAVLSGPSMARSVEHRHMDASPSADDRRAQEIWDKLRVAPIGTLAVDKDKWVWMKISDIPPSIGLYANDDGVVGGISLVVSNCGDVARHEIIEVVASGDPKYSDLRKRVRIKDEDIRIPKDSR
jgi:hypothetical protein